MGKLLVFESGAVKLQMGDVLLDVAAGTPCQFRQDVAAVNVNHGQFVFLGDVAQRVVCSPNIDQLVRYVSCNHLTGWLKQNHLSEAQSSLRNCQTASPIL